MIRDAGDGGRQDDSRHIAGPVLDIAYSRTGAGSRRPGADRTAKLLGRRDRPAPRGSRSEATPTRSTGSLSARRPRSRRASGDPFSRIGAGGPGLRTSGEVALWDVETCERVWSKKPPPARCSPWRSTPTRPRLAWGGFLRLTMSDVADGRILYSTDFHGGGQPVFSADGRWLGRYGNGSGLFMVENEPNPGNPRSQAGLTMS